MILGFSSRVRGVKGEGGGVLKLYERVRDWIVYLNKVLKGEI